MGTEGEGRGEVTEERETPSRVWAGLRVRRINASITAFTLSRGNVESLERWGRRSGVLGVCFLIFPPYFNSRCSREAKTGSDGDAAAAAARPAEMSPH